MKLKAAFSSEWVEVPQLGNCIYRRMSSPYQLSAISNHITPSTLSTPNTAHINRCVYLVSVKIRQTLTQNNHAINNERHCHRKVWWP